MCRADLVVQMVKDASNSHLLKQLVLANICQGRVVGRGPQTSLHQDSQRRTVQQGGNGDQTKQVDAINVLQAVQMSSAGLAVPTALDTNKSETPWSLADTSGQDNSVQLMADYPQESCVTSVFDAEPAAGRTIEHMHRHIIVIWPKLLRSVARHISYGTEKDLRCNNQQ